MYIPYKKVNEHAALLKQGLAKLPNNFTAFVCWWCEGTTIRNFESCSVCCKEGWHGNGLLYPGSVPAPDSVAYQVLNAAKGE